MHTEKKYVCYQGKETKSWCAECPYHQPDRRCGDRRQERGYRLFEKRTGFDNRRSNRTSQRGFLSMLRAIPEKLRDQPKQLAKILVLVNAYNLADYILTMNALSAGNKELNPVMRSMFEAGLFPAGLFKVSTVLAVTLLIWNYRRYKKVLQFAAVPLAGYIVLISYHLYGVLMR